MNTSRNVRTTNSKTVIDAVFTHYLETIESDVCVIFLLSQTHNFMYR